MVSRSWASSGANAAQFGRAVLVGFGEIWLCPSALVGGATLAAALLLSARAGGLALAGALVATGWAFWGQRDGRVLAAGWYGTNGALWGLWASSLVTDPLGAALLTVAGALLAVWILDRLVFPLGDAPIALPPLSLPFVVVALLASLALPVGRDLVARVAGPLVHEAAAEPPALWRPRVVPTAFAGDLAAAWDAWERADYARARGQFAALAAAAPDLADAHNGHGWALFRLGALTEADAAFRRAVALDARHPYSLDGLGWIAFRRGRYREAARFFRQAALGAPAWADPHDGLGWVAYTRGRFREAREHFDRAIALAPHHASALGGLGWTSLFEARVDEARRFFERASAADPGFLVAREGLGWALARSGRPREAERVFASILERSPGEREALTGLADARRRLALRGEGPARAARSEWEAVRRALPPSAAAVSIAAAAVVLLRMPWAGLAGLLCVVAGATLSVLTAGPSALAWLDLHVQTLAPLGLLIGRLTSPSMRALGRVAAAAGAGVAVWALQHAAGMTLPLLAFNGVGLTFLALGTARFTRDGRLSAAE